MRRFATGLLILLSAVCLLASSLSLWTRRNVINTQVFVSNVEAMVDLPQVESRINQRVTDTVMTNPDVQDAIDNAMSILPPRLQQFRPTVENGIRSLISAGVARLLTNDPFRPLTTSALTTAHDQLVNGQPVRFTLGQAKERIPASAKDGLAGQVLDLLPNDVGVTVVTPADAPQLYNAIDLLKSVWWWLGLLALALLAGALGLSRYRRGTLRAWSVTTTLLLLLTLIALRVGRGQLVVRAKPENRDALGAIYDVLAQSLRSWTLWLLGFVLLVLVLTLVWGRLGVVAAVRRGWGSARAQIAARREAHRAVQAAAPQAPGSGSAAELPPVSEESWPRRVAANTRAFAEGLELDRRTAHLGGFVRDHHKPAQWGGIVIGALVLLFWPSPTLSVLIWIGAIVALYLGALSWLEGRAPAVPEPDQGTPAAGEPAPPVPMARSGADGRVPLVPSSRPPADGVAGTTLVATRPAEVATEAPVSAEASVSPAAMADLSDRLDLLVRLGQARDAGVLTEEEFTREKSRLLTA